MCPVSGAPSGWPVSTFHNRTVLSVSALASRRPSGLKAIPTTTSGGEKVRLAYQIPHPHRAVFAPAGQLCSVGAEGKHVDDVGVADQWCADALAANGIPQPHRVVVTGGGQPVPVGAISHIHHGAGVVGERLADR